jgi:hypothetical protein
MVQQVNESDLTFLRERARLIRADAKGGPSDDSPRAKEFEVSSTVAGGSITSQMFCSVTPETFAT